MPVFVAVAAPITTVNAAECGGRPTAIINCEQKGGEGADVEETGLWGLLLMVINILTAGVGVVALGGIVYGSVLYATARGSVEQTKKAQAIFRSVVIGVVLFAGMYMLLEFIVPGGVFN